MKNKKVAAYFGIALFALAAGCGKAGGEPSVPAAESADTERPKDSSENQSGDDGRQKGTDSASDTAQRERETETLTGSVSSIGKGSMVISQSFEEEGGVLVAPADGSPDQVLVTVRISEETQYEVKTVKNGGVNGDADVEKTSGSFSDLEQDLTVDLMGYYDGEEFAAQKICIYRFV